MSDAEREARAIGKRAQAGYRMTRPSADVRAGWVVVWGGDIETASMDNLVALAALADAIDAYHADAPAGMLIFAQVRLATLVDVQSWARRDKTHWYKIPVLCTCPL